jgi:hypothetical protein
MHTAPGAAQHPTHLHISILIHIIYLAYKYPYKVRNAWSYSSTVSYAFMTYAWTLTPSISLTGNEKRNKCYDK